jgi:hypothetical protein
LKSEIVKRGGNIREPLQPVALGAGSPVSRALPGPVDAPRKIVIAGQLRQEGVSYRWMTDALHMGAANTIRTHVFVFTNAERRDPV